MFVVIVIDHIVLKTNQLEKMIAFYCTILGCKVEKIQPEIALTQIRAGDNLIDLVAIEQPLDKTHKNLEHFCLRVKPFNFENLKRYFDVKGVEVRKYGKRTGAQGIGFSFYIEDPEGNEIELTGLVH